MARDKMRVMWLLNHSSARKFEVAMLKRIGIEEIFLPKIFPHDLSFRSASVDYSEDGNLSIPEDELAILNAQDWYGRPTKEAWSIANRYFSVIFFIFFKPEIFESIANNFTGSAIWRIYGRTKDLSYSEVLKLYGNKDSKYHINTLGRQFWFGEAYDHLRYVEDDFLQSRAVYLPLGLDKCDVSEKWTGGKNYILFVCPDIKVHSVYAQYYNDFKDNFGDLPYLIGGTQGIAVDDKSVLGYLPLDQHLANMRELKVMFYHSTEPNHIHYHPFEAIRAGMPLVFMAGGLLDSMGGKDQPGRCKNISEARRKLGRILENDTALIRSIRENQVRLLDPMRPENCEQAWRVGFSRITDELKARQIPRPLVVRKPRQKIAVIAATGIYDDIFSEVRLLAETLIKGSSLAGEEVDITLAYIEEESPRQDEELAKLRPISCRTFEWKILDKSSARSAMRFAGHDWEPSEDFYLIPDDGIQQLTECDLWIIFFNGLTCPVLPLRPYVLVADNYLPRYNRHLQNIDDSMCINSARLARHVLVTTEFARNDALQYAGIRQEKVSHVPMLFQHLDEKSSLPSRDHAENYFILEIEFAVGNSNLATIQALKDYYEIYDGQLDCRIIGQKKEAFLNAEQPYSNSIAEAINESRDLGCRVTWLGKLPQKDRSEQFMNCNFFWYPENIGKTRCRVVEAAYFGAPTICADHPVMRELVTQFQLNLTWMDSRKPGQMAKQLKMMEEESISKINTNQLRSNTAFGNNGAEISASIYWKVIRECL